MNIFFTADTHFGHGRIIEYCSRPFKASGVIGKNFKPAYEVMDEAILQRFNEVLRPGDVLYHLGDVSWSSFPKKTGFLDRLNTKEVHLIWGNHDKPKDFKDLPFRSFQDIKRIHVDKKALVLCHYPMRSWHGKGEGAYQLYGHVHGKMPGLGRQMDVGVDTHAFYPWAWEEVDKLLRDIPVFEGEKN
jgi:calcineurin-like phosphoesterase family protein